MNMQLDPAINLKKRIMQRVYAVWFWRSVAPLLAVEFILLIGVAVGVLTHISIRHIMLNALQASANVQAFIMFFVNNFFVKSIQSRLLVAVYLVLVVFFARDIRNALRRLKGLGKDELLVALAEGGNRGGAFISSH